MHYFLLSQIHPACPSQGGQYDASNGYYQTDKTNISVVQDGDSYLLPSLPRLGIQTSLPARKYGEYSSIPDSPTPGPPGLAFGPEEEIFSQLKTATPVRFRKPKSRPSLISILSTSEQSGRSAESSPTLSSTPQQSRNEQLKPSATCSHMSSRETYCFGNTDPPALRGLELSRDAPRSLFNAERRLLPTAPTRLESHPESPSLRSDSAHSPCMGKLPTTNLLGVQRSPLVEGPFQAQNLKIFPSSSELGSLNASSSSIGFGRHTRKVLSPPMTSPAEGHSTDHDIRRLLITLTMYLIHSRTLSPI